MKYLGIILSLAAFVLMASCAVAPLIEELRRERIKRASKSYTEKYEK